MKNNLKISQGEKGYRFSIDPFLLADFTALGGSERVADLGTGCGVIALLLAAGNDAVTVTGVELQSDLVEIAKNNVYRNGLDGRVEIIRGDIREIHSLLQAGSFDVVVGNPPYRKLNSGRVNPDPGKALARHEVALSLEEFVGACAFLLSKGGSVGMIYHPARLVELFNLFDRYDITPKRLRSVHSRADSSAAMVLVEGVMNGKNPLTIEKPLVILNKEGGYTDEAADVYPEQDISSREDAGEAEPQRAHPWERRTNG